MEENNLLPVFGRDTRRIFKEIDVIRTKQVELAKEHICLESMVPTTEDDYQKNLEYFNNKEKALNSLMSKLDDLGQIMNDFREASDLNPHTMTRRVSDGHVAGAEP
ncbi:unnamed protein product [Mucor hiemalis]